MFCSRESNNFVTKVLEGGLRLIHRDETKDVQQIPREENDITIQQRNLQVLLTEVYKVAYGVAPSIINSFFKFDCNTHNT